MECYGAISGAENGAIRDGTGAVGGSTPALGVAYSQMSGGASHSRQAA